MGQLSDGDRVTQKKTKSETIWDDLYLSRLIPSLLSTDWAILIWFWSSSSENVRKVQTKKQTSYVLMIFTMSSRQIILIFSTDAEAKERRKWKKLTVQLDCFQLKLLSASFHTVFLHFGQIKYLANKSMKLFLAVTRENRKGSNKKSSYTINLPVPKHFRFSCFHRQRVGLELLKTLAIVCKLSQT